MFGSFDLKSPPSCASPSQWFDTSGLGYATVETEVLDQGSAWDDFGQPDLMPQEGLSGSPESPWSPDVAPLTAAPSAESKCKAEPVLLHEGQRAQIKQAKGKKRRIRDDRDARERHNEIERKRRKRIKALTDGLAHELNLVVDGTKMLKVQHISLLEASLAFIQRAKTLYGVPVEDLEPTGKPSATQAKQPLYSATPAPEQKSVALVGAAELQLAAEEESRDYLSFVLAQAHFEILANLASETALASKLPSIEKVDDALLMIPSATITRQGLILTCNDCLGALLGRSIPELNGKLTLFHLVWALDMLKVQKALQTIVEDEPQILEVTIMSKTEEGKTVSLPVWLLLTLMPIPQSGRQGRRGGIARLQLCQLKCFLRSPVNET